MNAITVIDVLVPGPVGPQGPPGPPGPLATSYVANVRDFGAVGDGVTDDAAAIQSAINYAATFTPPRQVYAPAGVYLIGTRVQFDAISPGQGLRGDEGATVFLLGPNNVSNPCILNLNSGMTRATVEGITFDGNAANSTLARPLVQLAAWSDGVTIRHCRFRNSNHTAINAPGDQPLTITANGVAAAGQPVVQFVSRPAALKVGAYVAGSAIFDSDMYLVAVTDTSATFNRALPDTVLNGTVVPFSRAFTTAADAFYGDIVLPTTDTTGLAVGMMVTIAGNGCFQTYTRISAINPNVAVTLDRFLLNKLPAGSNVAAAMGHARLTVESCQFEDIGQSRMTAGSRSYATVGAQLAGSYQLTLRNYGATWAGKVGVYPGQKTAKTGLPAGVPADCMIRDLVVNAASNTHTITLAAPLTASVPDNTAIPFQTTVGGAGYGIWQAWGATFAQCDAKFLYNRFEHTWAACIYAVNARALFMGNHYIQDQMEYRDPNVAPSPCLGIAGCVSPRIIGEYGSGATGTAVEAQHVIGLIMSGCEFSRNGARSSSIHGGHSNIVNGVIFNDNGQYINVPVVQDYAVVPGAWPDGLFLSGTGNFSQPGTMANISVSNIIASDTQSKPTQYYGMIAGWSGATFVNYHQGVLIGTGNKTALFDPVLAGKVAANAWSIGATWTQGAGKPAVSQPAGSIYSRTNGGASTTLYTTHGAGIWNPLLEGDGNAPGEGKVLYQTGVPISNIGADLNEETLLTYAIPAGTFGNVGDIVHVVAGGNFAATTDNKIIRLRMGNITGTIVCNPNGYAPDLTTWTLEAWIVKTGTNAQSFVAIGCTNGIATGTNAGTSAWADPNPINLLVDGINTSNAVPGSITVQNFLVETLQ